MNTQKKINKINLLVIFNILVRITLFSLLWWIIVQGRADAWLIGLPAVIVATILSFKLSGYLLPKLSLTGALIFISLFIRESISGGIDVARRTLRPEMLIQPGFDRYRLNIDDPFGRLLFINCISLLPGTLAADLDEKHVDIHMLDIRQDPLPQLQRIETAIINMLRLQVETANG